MAIIPSLTRLCTLGLGSTATVSLASEPTSGGLFAIKSAELYCSTPLKHEHRILSSLSSPHIISSHGSYTSASHFHLLLEFAPGGSLFDRISSCTKGHLDEHEIRLYTREILLGLLYLHSNSISHGDIKSQNILIDSDGRAKIADFGCAVRKSGTHNDESASLSGTPAFMAPEVARGEERGPAADIWGIGCTIIEMTTGKAPWHGVIKDQDVIAAIYRIGYCSDSVPEIPDWLSEEGQDFLMNCLKRDPNERGTAEQLLKHRFVSVCDAGLNRDGNSVSVFSPQSTLDFDVGFCVSETEEEEEETGLDPVERIRALAGYGSGLVLFGSDPNDENWIQVRSRSEEGETEGQVGTSGYDLDTDFILFNFADAFERINERERCVYVNSVFHECADNSINKAVNSPFDQNSNPFLFVFNIFFLISFT